MPAYGLVVRFELKPGHEAAFDALVARTVAAIKQHEPGTLVYANHAVRDAPTSRVFYELYADRAAFDAHEATEHTRAFLDQRGEHVESHTVTFLDHLASTVVPA